MITAIKVLTSSLGVRSQDLTIWIIEAQAQLIQKELVLGKVLKTESVDPALSLIEDALLKRIMKMVNSYEKLKMNWKKIKTLKSITMSKLLKQFSLKLVELGSKLQIMFLKANERICKSQTPSNHLE